MNNENEKHFCSLKYIDTEGEQIILHEFLSVKEQRELIEKCANHGFEIQIYDLSLIDDH